MHRFFVASSSIQQQNFCSTEPELCHQISKVLKMRTGQKMTLCDNNEHELTCELSIVNKNKIEGAIIGKKTKPDISSERAIHLFVPPLKNPSRWEWMLEKCTEIGVASFNPLITERTEVKELRKLDRLERIIREAAEQSGRTKLPIIHEPISFKNILESEDGHPRLQGVNLIAALSPEAKPLRGYQLQTTNYNLYFGPVGDFTEKELHLALEHKFYPVTLGSQILRTETAAIVATSQILLS